MNVPFDGAVRVRANHDAVDLLVVGDHWDDVSGEALEEALFYVDLRVT